MRDNVDICDFAVRRTGRDQRAVVRAGGAAVGSGDFAVIAGPCAIETRQSLFALAESVRRSGAAILRGGAYKPRTSPYDFQGLGPEGLGMLADAGRRTGLPTLSEIVSESDLEYFENIDMLQIGARNMRNYSLLKAAGRTKKPILLKRAPDASPTEFLASAEYILKEGNPNVALCERGSTLCGHGVLDLNALRLLKKMTYLPVIADPTHSSNGSEFVRALALAACAAGADGIMVEVHASPKDALCDGDVAIEPDEFDRLCRDLRRLRGLRICPTD